MSPLGALSQLVKVQYCHAWERLSVPQKVSVFNSIECLSNPRASGGLWQPPRSLPPKDPTSVFYSESTNSKTDIAEGYLASLPCEQLRQGSCKQQRSWPSSKSKALLSFSPHPSSLQVLFGPLHHQREKEATADPDDVHQRSAEGAGKSLRRDPLSRHLHKGRAGPQDRPHGSQGAGKGSGWGGG